MSARKLILVMHVLLLSWVAAIGGAAANGTDDAFTLTVTRNGDRALDLRWTIAPGYHLYHDQFSAMTAAGATLPLVVGPGETVDDANFGVTEIHRRAAEAWIAADAAPARGDIEVSYQGCADAGVCLPPVHRRIDVASLSLARDAPPAEAPSASPLSGRFAAMFASFVGFGLLLSLTPCVFPMLPILSGLIAGAGGAPERGALLAAVYTLAMACAYALIGVAAAWSGQNLQLVLQAPLAIALMSVVFVALAASSFGLFDLELPSAWVTRVSVATRGRSGSLRGAALVGFGSALIVGPCVTPPLAAALIYVADSGDVLRGASALFALGLGMGLPLIAFGAFGARLMPKSGPWLAKVKQAFGFVFLALAVWMLARIAPSIWARFGSIGLGLGFVVWMGASLPRAWTTNVFGRPRIAATAAFLLLTSGALVGFWLDRAALQPDRATMPPAEGFGRTVSTPSDFDAALRAARTQGLPILVDFTADWCASCRTFERTVLADPAISARLRQVSIIRADLTSYSAQSETLMRRFGVVGPPTLLFLAPSTGAEIPSARSVGEITIPEFGRSLERAGA